MLKLKNIKKSFSIGNENYKVIKNISLEINEGEFCIIYGQSGSGKTTLLNIMGTLEQANSGNVYYDQSDISQFSKSKLRDIREKYVGFIFQSYHLFPQLTAKENILLGSYLSKTLVDVDNILKMVGLYEHKDKYTYQLSGGQQQRVAIARAIAKQPKILFCDEPTGALDTETGYQILSVLKTLQLQKSITIVMVTHNPDIKDLADKLIYIKDGKVQDIIHNQQPKTVEMLRGKHNDHI